MQDIAHARMFRRFITGENEDGADGMNFMNGQRDIAPIGQSRHHYQINAHLAPAAWPCHLITFMPH